ncbi:MAG: hypothetical protein GY861_06640 [bacterium]|nr:hypothetical protein [bacterium]
MNKILPIIMPGFTAPVPGGVVEIPAIKITLTDEQVLLNMRDFLVETFNELPKQEEEEEEEEETEL